eukprot:CAMPEP_0168728388 /NCGR_PEP_ID=MMETSP0724-20121128/5658_1 /TAXON_ID=265536 /ORGANISM="Amphiprora sp., Strain CCMP467" /LENGTH=148 /DNA_ID=CAMNT_0008775231 /DNA_START=56 /DNA_END=502 /DNA_ORIENTATION=+
MYSLPRFLVSFLLLLAVVAGKVRANDEHILANGENIVQYVVHNIEENDVMVFAKSYCPHCQQTRHLLEELHKEFEGWSLKIVDIDTNPEDGRMIQNLLAELTGQRTVPNIFIDGEHLGGNEDLQEIFEEGNLIPMLEELAGKSVSDEI